MKASERSSDALRIGVTGHRLLLDTEAIESGVHAAIEHTRRAFPDKRFEIVTALAEGADRMVATVLCDGYGYDLHVVLPLPREDYIQDFATQESREDFERMLGQAKSCHEISASPIRPRAYEVAGRFIVDACDVLLAVWDGEKADGPGGTGDVVAYARKKGRPIAIISAGNRDPETGHPTTLHEDQGRVAFKNFPEME